MDRGARATWRATSLSDALTAVARLRGEGFGTILDVLGEGVETVAQAQAAAAEYQRALAALPAVDPGCVVSVKPTHLGLLLDPALCERLLSELCTAAARQGRRVRLEMEDAPTVDATLAVFRGLRARHPNLGCVLQARLFRTEADARALLEQGPGLNVRLVKGIYLEPASIAWTAAPDIARSYVQLARLLLDGGAFVGLATHDGAMAAELDRLPARARPRPRRAGRAPLRVPVPHGRAPGLRPGAAQRRPRRAHLRPLRQRLARLLAAPPAPQPADRAARPARHAARRGLRWPRAAPPRCCWPC